VTAEEVSDGDGCQGVGRCAPPDVGIDEARSAIARPMVVMNADEINQPQIIETGPP
jgi:hypothetical protein